MPRPPGLPQPGDDALPARCQGCARPHSAPTARRGSKPTRLAGPSRWRRAGAEHGQADRGAREFPDGMLAKEAVRQGGVPVRRSQQAGRALGRYGLRPSRPSLRSGQTPECAGLHRHAAGGGRLVPAAGTDTSRALGMVRGAGHSGVGSPSACPSGREDRRARGGRPRWRSQYLGDAGGPGSPRSRPGSRPGPPPRPRPGMSAPALGRRHGVIFRRRRQRRPAGGCFRGREGLETLPASEAGPIAAWRVTYASASPRPGAGAWGHRSKVRAIRRIWWLSTGGGGRDAARHLPRQARRQ